MAISALIYLTPPYLAVQQTARVYGITLPTQSPLTFGYIGAINFNTIGYNVGDRILYPEEVTNPVILIGDSQEQYSIVSENKIILIEPISPPL